MNELFARLKSESPDYFKKIKKFALWLMGVAGAVLLVDIPENIHIPNGIMTACSYIVFGGSILFGSASLPVKDHSEMTDKMKETKP
jgi:hypothetical protein